MIAASHGTQANSPFDTVLTKREVTRPGLYDQARSIEPRLRNYANDHILGNHLTAQGCSNLRKVIRRQGWTFPPLADCRAAWETRFPGWRWRNPEITAWWREEQEDVHADMAEAEQATDIDDKAIEIGRQRVADAWDAQGSIDPSDVDAIAAADRAVAIAQAVLAKATAAIH
jgi:hypothetical protein